MNQVFLDTSATLALVNPQDHPHASARRAFDTLAARKAGLPTTSFVLVETYPLLAEGSSCDPRLDDEDSSQLR